MPKGEDIGFGKGYLKEGEIMECPACRGSDFFVYSVELRKHSYNSVTKEWGISEAVEWSGKYNDSVVCRKCGKEIPEQVWKLE